MVIIITGTTHTGKTALAQKLLSNYHYPYLSLDHLKMGLIRSKETTITVEEDEQLTKYLWKIVKEIIKTVIENNQNIIIEGCYIPFDWQSSFSEEYLSKIKYYCLIMTENYLRNNFETIKQFANIVEQRITSDLNLQKLIADNFNNLHKCQEYKLNYLLIDQEYILNIEL